MPLFDLQGKALTGYKPKLDEPKDFDAFWRQTLAEARRFATAPRLSKVAIGLKTVDTWDLSFSGYGGAPVRGWFQAPAGAKGPLPCVVEFVGYGGGRGHAWDWLFWPSAGYAHLVMDTRGQGGGWQAGDTADPSDQGAPAHPGFMTRGILSPQSYYYRRVFTDAAMAVGVARSLGLVDPGRVAVSGGSQGGGISLAAAGLVPEVAACLPDVPFLCHFRRAIAVTDAYPYQELVKYLQVQRLAPAMVLRTLGYFDGLSFAKRAKAPALFSVGLMDEVCPPSTVYAAYNHYRGPKAMRVWEYNHHEGGGSLQAAEKLAFLNRLFAKPARRKKR